MNLCKNLKKNVSVQIEGSRNLKTNEEKMKSFLKKLHAFLLGILLH